MSLRDRIIEETTQSFCSHANCKVELKTTYVYPSDIMPDMTPRIQHRGCSHYFACSLHDKSTCTFGLDKINKPNLHAEATE